MSNKRAEDVVIGKNHVSLELQFSANATVRHFICGKALQPTNNDRIGEVPTLVASRT